MLESNGNAAVEEFRESKKEILYCMFRMRLLVIRNVYKERERGGFVMWC